MAIQEAGNISAQQERALAKGTAPSEYRLGATWSPDGTCTFLVWAPRASSVELCITQPKTFSRDMQALEHGYFFCALKGEVEPGARYRYRLNCDGTGRERPDPASRKQPEGVHGDSEVIDPRFEWTDAGWRGLPLEKYVIYELHVGTFTPEGTFDAAISRLADLRETGITAIEIMPVAQFPGARNWGYDGVYPFAAQNSYGGPVGLKRLVNACHAHRITVVLDVVYNHFGPVGNYTADFANYSTGSYKTPWGDGMNFDGPGSDEVRRFFSENALQWVDGFHIDALRLDAIHEMVDTSAEPFLKELAEVVHARGDKLQRLVYLFAENDRDDRRILAATNENGFGYDAVWDDDFHHAMHVMLTGETAAYFQDFRGGVEDLAKAWREGFVYTGQYSEYRKHHHGSPSTDIPGKRFIVFVQNHDQIGNRTVGDRLSHSISFEKVKLAAGTVLLSPFVPMIFMGEEYAEDAPFQYFVSHGDPELHLAIHEGRKNDFSKFNWAGEALNPGSEVAFESSKLNWDLRREGKHALLLDLYRELLRLRREIPALAHLDKHAQEVRAFRETESLLVERWHQGSRICAVFHFGEGAAKIREALPPGKWRRLVDSADQRWRGPGAIADELLQGGDSMISVGGWAFALYLREA